MQGHGGEALQAEAVAPKEAPHAALRELCPRGEGWQEGGRCRRAQGCAAGARAVRPCHQAAGAPLNEHATSRCPLNSLKESFFPDERGGEGAPRLQCPGHCCASQASEADHLQITINPPSCNHQNPHRDVRSSKGRYDALISKHVLAEDIRRAAARSPAAMLAATLLWKSNV